VRQTLDGMSFGRRTTGRLRVRRAGACTVPIQDDLLFSLYERTKGGVATAPNVNGQDFDEVTRPLKI